MISLRYNLHRNNYPEHITLAPRNLHRRIEDSTWKLTTVCLPYVKGLAERIQKICSPYDIRSVFTSGSTLKKYLFWVKPPTEFNMIKNCVYSIPCSYGKIYKGETGRPLKVRLEEHWKAPAPLSKRGRSDLLPKNWGAFWRGECQQSWKIFAAANSSHLQGKQRSPH